MYLDEQELNSRMSLGKPVEQWLGVVTQSEYKVLRWIRVGRERDGSYMVSYFEMFDEDGEDFLDIYEFNTIDPDEPHGVITAFVNYNDALLFFLEKYKCSNDKFVGFGMIQEEYRKYRNSENRD